ncbi:MAG: hypothetical protein COT16_01710 [Elusimicrobia bacterium CG08_land_8_20_14_0_20_44_26]|nr:MAG: hypothetical protein COT16_01710 [Elusimicrobia bacterium CG08_land_8_20_14_0_20_44_26]
MTVLYPLILNLGLAVIFFIIPDYRKFIRRAAVIFSAAGFALSIAAIFSAAPEMSFILFDTISKMLYVAVSFFGVLLSVYSAGIIEERLNKYFSYFFLTLFASQLTVISADWIVLATGWGLSGICLYLLMQFETGAAAAAKKAMIIIGGSDSFLILGVAVLYNMTGSFSMVPAGWSLLAVVSMLAASFAKAGVFPLHTWIPETADKAPVAVTAFLPAALDKLLGIYLASRIFQIFTFPQEVRIAVMLIGAFTIISAVFMALSQHTAKKLLAYHAVSQTGYMILGIACGSPVGCAGGLFHMLNHAIYKCALFLGIGQVEKTAASDKIEELGGLAKIMPVTFTSMFIASLAISGIPPLNGFYSKWLVYQGILQSLTTDFPFLTMLCLIAAIFGSALTLASFVKLLHSVFLGVKLVSPVSVAAKPEKFSLILPQIILAAFCVLLGIFAKNLFIDPVFGNITLSGWNPGAAAVLIIAGIILGLVIYLVSGAKTRRVKNYIGGENISPEMNVSGVEFYASIENIFPFRQIYSLAKKYIFDFYEALKALVFYIIKPLRYIHDGILTDYLSWIFIGGIIILLSL